MTTFPCSVLWFGLALAPLAVGAPSQGIDGAPIAREEFLAIAFDDPATQRGRVVLMETSEPWDFIVDELETERGSVLHAAHGRLMAMSFFEGTVRCIDLDTWSTTHLFALAPAFTLEGMALASPDLLYVTRSDSAELWLLEISTGKFEPVVDLAPLADADGNPDLGTLAIAGGRLFVQVRRFPNDGPWPPDLLPLIAVVDLETRTLIDVEPGTPGVQGIALAGTAPKFKMQVLPRAGRLFVSSTGAFFDEGGIEEIDLASLSSLGLVIHESDHQTGADIGAFVMTGPRRGFLIYSTDFALSSHLLGFRHPGGLDPAGELHMCLNYFSPALVHAPAQRLVFMPQAEFGGNGIHVFTAAHGTRLTSGPILTGGAPTDLELVLRLPRPAGGLSGL